MSDQSSELDKYKTTLNFDDLTPNSSLGLMSSNRQRTPSPDRYKKHQQDQQLFVRNLMRPPATDNLKLEELASSKPTASARESRWQRNSANNEESYISNLQELI